MAALGLSCHSRRTRQTPLLAEAGVGAARSGGRTYAICLGADWPLPGDYGRPGNVR